MTTESLRRRAAVQVLEPWLDAEALQQALWMQIDAMRDVSVSAVIRFIDPLGDLHGWDAPLRKRLYAQLFQSLQASGEALPPDPWPSGHVPAGLAPVRAAPMPPAVALTPPPEPLPVLAPPLPVASAPARDPVDAAAVAMFAHLTRDILAQVVRLHPEAPAEVASDVRRRLGTLSLPAPVLAGARTAWSAPHEQDWHLGFSSAELRRLMGALQDALIQSFGVAGTRHVLQRAVQGAQALPAARDCAPQDLLRWL